ncbi:hypothetical protein D3C77_433750 [compost metagenome]
MIFGWRSANNAGIVDENVNVARKFKRFIEGFLQFTVIAQVDFDGRSFSAQALDLLYCLVTGAYGGADHICSCLGEADGDALTQSAGSSCY